MRERDKIVDVTIKGPPKIKQKGWWKHWTCEAVGRASFGSTPPSWAARRRRVSGRRKQRQRELLDRGCLRPRGSSYDISLLAWLFACLS